MTEHDPFAAAPPDLRELLALASDFALQAGRIHAEGRREALRVETKSSPTDLVSQVDTAAERLIVDRLRSERPDDAHPVRRGRHGRHERGTLGRRPLGRDDQRPATAIRPTPSPSRSRSEARSGWASSSTPARGGCTGPWPNGCRARRPPHRGARAARAGNGSRRHGLLYAAEQRDHEGAVLAALIGRIRDIRRGSAALDLCRLAAGEVDAYWELDLSPWDFAAGVLIAREAGAEVGWCWPPKAGAPPSSARTRRSCRRSRRCCARPASYHVAGRRGLSRAARGARAARR